MLVGSHSADQKKGVKTRVVQVLKYDTPPRAHWSCLILDRNHGST